MSSSFEEFRRSLAVKLDAAEKMGMNHEQIAQRAEKMAGWLAKATSPTNDEERLLKELWQVSDQQERDTLSHILTKFIDKTPTH